MTVASFVARHRGRILAALTAIAVVWHVVSVAGPAWSTVRHEPSRGRDFATYYYALQVALDGGDPYQRGELGGAARQEGTRQTVHPYLYPPPFLLLMAWAAPMDLLSAYRAWFWLDELWMLAGMLALWRWWRPLGPALGPTLALAVAAFSAVPANHVMGQANFAGLTLAILGLWAVDRDRWAIGGALMGAACMVKMSPALFLGWWLLHERWKPVVVACLAAVALTLAVVPILDLERQVVFYTRVLPTFGSGDYNGLTIPIGMFANHSLPNVWHQLGPQPARGLSWEAQVASTVSAVVLLGGLLWRFRRTGDPLAMAAQVSAIGVALLLVPVYTYEHHCVWAIPSVVVTVLALLEGRLPRWSAAPIGLAVVAWAFDVYQLKGLYYDLAAYPAVALVVQEVKFAALVVFLVAVAQVGGDGVSRVEAGKAG